MTTRGTIAGTAPREPVQAAEPAQAPTIRPGSVTPSTGRLSMAQAQYAALLRERDRLDALIASLELQARDAGEVLVNPGAQTA